jgi:hypothetical protein
MPGALVASSLLAGLRKSLFDARFTVRRLYPLGRPALTGPAATLWLTVSRGQGAAVVAGHGVALVGHSGSGSETLGR